MPRRDPAEPTVEKGPDLSARLSFAWLLPIAALVFAAFVLWRSYAERGPLVEIRFPAADGVVAGETRVRRNDVDVGQVEAVRLADDLDSVVLEVRLDPQLAPFLDDDTRFWIVNARINTTEISGLGTLLSGAYVEIDWDGNREGERRDEFTGLTEPPLTKRGTPGLRLTLNADEAGYIYVGSPVFHRQIEVGRVERRTLSPDARQVQFDIFVEAPFHAHVYPDTRFYGVSGVEASIDADGAAVRVESIAALFTGGIAFDNPDVVEPESRVTEDGSRYRLHDSRRAARESLFDDAEDVRHRFTAAFEGSVKGLRVDAPIEYNGLRVGRVASVTTGLPEAPGEPGRSVVVLQLQPRRLGLPDVGVDELGARLGEFVAAGLRVQLATGNLLTGSMIIKLVDVPDAPPATIDAEAKPYPALPVVPSNVEAVTADVEELIRNLSELPLQALVASATELLQDAGKLVASPDVAGLPAQLADSLGSIATAASRVETATADLPAMLSALTSASRNADDVLAGLSPDSEIYIELAAAARELRIAARSIAAFAELLEENPNAVITGR